MVRNTVAVAGAIGTEQYVRTTADAVYYYSLFEDVVASVGGSVGLVLPYGGSYVRLNNLFFIGGDTLRGFAVGGIGPRDAGTTDLARRPVLLHGHGGAFLSAALRSEGESRSSARPSSTSVRCGASNPARPIRRRCWTASSCASRPASASSGCRHSARSALTMPGRSNTSRGTSSRTSASASAHASEWGCRGHERSSRPDQRRSGDLGGHQADPADDPAPLSDAHGRQGHRHAARPERRRYQERLDQRAVLPGSFPPIR